MNWYYLGFLFFLLSAAALLITYIIYFYYYTQNQTENNKNIAFGTLVGFLLSLLVCFVLYFLYITDPDLPVKKIKEKIIEIKRDFIVDLTNKEPAFPNL